MVEFGKKLIAAQHKPWSEYYLDYRRLKKALKVLSTDPTDAESGVKAEIRQELEGLNDSQYFRHLLDTEIEKVVLFYLREQGAMASRLSDLREQQKSFRQRLVGDREHIHGEEIAALVDLSSEFRDVGRDLILFVRFAELNATGLRKILKKHDKIFRSKPLTNVYLSQYKGEDDSHLEQLYNYDGIAALVTTIRRGLRESQLFERIGGLNNVVELEQVEEESGGLNNENGAVADTTTPYQSITSQQIRSYEKKMSSLSLYSEECNDSEEWGEPILEAIEIARLKLSQSTEYTRTLETTSLMLLEHPVSDEDYDSVSLLKKRKAAPARCPVSTFLNLASTFLYMTNYYIVAPTSGMYAARLGSDAALSGIIIGMTPWAALVSSVLYSWWANRSYKSALVFAAGCSLTGNILYALALPCKSLKMVLIARLLNGFGGARAINRRYIADVYRNHERTAGSVAFVTAGALGMAVGPGLAAIVDYLDIEEGDFWTEETAPGWIMFVAWTVFFISAIVFFREPVKLTTINSQPANQTSDKENLEMLPLVAKSDDDSSTGKKGNFIFSPKARPSLFTNIPVIMTLVIYLILKLALECVLSSTPGITKYYFDWNPSQSGTFLAILGVLMFPANAVLARLSRRYSDRYLIVVTTIMLTVGTFGILYYGSDPSGYTEVQYVIFAIFIFLSTNMLEGVNMSLLSKTIPKSWARGTFNSGLLATEAGTLGRALGDVVISATALAGFDRMLNLTFAPLGIMSVVTLAVTWKAYSYLVPADDDDEDSNA